MLVSRVESLGGFMVKFIQIAEGGFCCEYPKRKGSDRRMHLA